MGDFIATWDIANCFRYIASAWDERARERCVESVSSFDAARTPFRFGPETGTATAPSLASVQLRPRVSTISGSNYTETAKMDPTLHHMNGHIFGIIGELHRQFFT